jgi:hypothetical protein
VVLDVGGEVLVGWDEAGGEGMGARDVPAVCDVVADVILSFGIYMVCVEYISICLIFILLW